LNVLVLRNMDSIKVVENLPFLSEMLVIVGCEGLERVSNIPQVRELRAQKCLLVVCGEVGQLAPAVSGRGYARCLLAVAAWTPRAAPAAARRRPGCLHLAMIVHSCDYARVLYLLKMELLSY